jgi:hypothetical protein
LRSEPTFTARNPTRGRRAPRRGGRAVVTGAGM